MRKIFAIATLLTLICIASTFGVCSAEVSSTYVASETVQINSTTHEELNRQNYVNYYISDISVPDNFSTSQKSAFAKQLLHEVGVKANHIDKISDTILVKIAEAESVTMSSILFGDKFDSGSTEYDDITIYSALVYNGLTTTSSGAQQKEYTAIVLAFWNKMPRMRLTDVISLTTSNTSNVHYGTSSDFLGGAEFYYTDSHGNRGSDYYEMSNSNDDVMWEYSPIGFLGAKINLPEDRLLINRKYYHEAYISIVGKLSAPVDCQFSMYSSYGHLYIGIIGSEAVISSSPGVAIEFGANTTNYSSARIGTDSEW